MRTAMTAVDGNHEAWPSLNCYLQRHDTPLNDPHPIHLGGSLWWARRGSAWTWSGARCGALGGAVSVDKWWSGTAGMRWPDDEAPTVRDLRRFLTNTDDGLNVVFCHDAPRGVRGLFATMRGIPIEIEAEANDVRDLLRTAVERTRPAVLFHGHWHQRNRELLEVTDTDVVGLSHDERPRGHLAVLDATTLDADYVHRGSDQR